MSVLVPILVIAVLVLLNGLFVAAEFAIIGVSRTTIERRAATGHPVAKLVHQILQNPLREDRYIATAQLGISLASLGLGMYGEHALADWIAQGLEDIGLSGSLRFITAHSLASILAVAVLTFFHIVIGEMVPKSMALMHAERTALWITRPMLWMKAAFYPFVIGLNGLGNMTLRLMGVKRQVSSGHYYSPEELQFIVRESQEGGLLRAELGKVLRDLFDFGDRLAREVMVPRVFVSGIPLHSSPEELKSLIIANRHTRYPVYGEDLDHVEGVIHIKDLLRILREGRALERKDVRPAAFVPETAELDRVVEAMRTSRTQLVIVMDEHGGTAGIVSIEDLCDEAIGEVEEGPDDAPELITDRTGRIIASGTLRLDDLGEHLGFVLDHEEVDTISGLVLALLDRPPLVGDSVSYRDVRFDVAEIEGHGVKRCIITPPKPAEGE